MDIKGNEKIIKDRLSAYIMNNLLAGEKEKPKE
jgi:hypothetical protein